MEFRESKTYQNLLTAYNVEVNTSGSYSLFATRARNEGYIQIANIFDQTARNELEHARLFTDQIYQGNPPNTYDNLIFSAKQENYVWSTLYRDFARIATEEGYPDIAKLFVGIAYIERHHDVRFETLAENIRTNTVFCKETERAWICLICGNIHYGTCAPERCYVCGYPQSYYELLCENY